MGRAKTCRYRIFFSFRPFRALLALEKTGGKAKLWAFKSNTPSSTSSARLLSCPQEILLADSRPIPNHVTWHLRPVTVWHRNGVRWRVGYARGCDLPWLRKHEADRIASLIRDHRSWLRRKAEIFRGKGEESWLRGFCYHCIGIRAGLMDIRFCSLHVRVDNFGLVVLRWGEGGMWGWGWVGRSVAITGIIWHICIKSCYWIDAIFRRWAVGIHAPATNTPSKRLPGIITAGLAPLLTGISWFLIIDRIILDGVLSTTMGNDASWWFASAFASSFATVVGERDIGSSRGITVKLTGCGKKHSFTRVCIRWTQSLLNVLAYRHDGRYWKSQSSISTYRLF